MWRSIPAIKTLELPMFSLTTENGIRVSVRLTPTNRVLLHINNPERLCEYEHDITASTYGCCLLGLPVNHLNVASDMTSIGLFFQAVNDHWVFVEEGSYCVACPMSKGFSTRHVALHGTIDERISVTMLACPQCHKSVAIPKHELSLFKHSQRLTVPKWREPQSIAAG